MNTNSLSGRIALVTGGAHRVGRAIALALAEARADLVIHYHRSAEAAAATVREIEALGRRALTMPADLSDVDQIGRLFQRVEQEFGQLDILINSASVF